MVSVGNSTNLFGRLDGPAHSSKDHSLFMKPVLYPLSN